MYLRFLQNFFRFFFGEKYTREELDYDCRIYSLSLIDKKVPLWNNRNLGLTHQTELDHMDKEQIKAIFDNYDSFLTKL